MTRRTECVYQSARRYEGQFGQEEREEENLFEECVVGLGPSVLSRGATAASQDDYLSGKYE